MLDPYIEERAMTMDLFTAINSRSSSIKLIEPGPTREHLERIMLAGARAPDHGRLAPWRFVVLEGAAREVLANASIELLLAEEPQATEAQIARERDKPMRAPTIIAVAAHLTRGHKVPEHEQVQAVAAAVQNMFLAAHALGYGATWKTGAAARSAIVNRALGFEADDEIVAFLYLGTNATAGPVRAASIEGKARWL
jgi:nitroreductase